MGIFESKGGKEDKVRRKRATPVKNFILGASLAFNVCAYEMYQGALQRNYDAPSLASARQDSNFLAMLSGR